jgi:hypothetical protein
MGPRTGTAMSIKRWVMRHFAAVQIGRVAVYDLSSPT